MIDSVLFDAICKIQKLYVMEMINIQVLKIIIPTSILEFIKKYDETVTEVEYAVYSALLTKSITYFNSCYSNLVLELVSELKSNEDNDFNHLFVLTMIDGDNVTTDKFNRVIRFSIIPKSCVINIITSLLNDFILKSVTEKYLINTIHQPNYVILYTVFPEHITTYLTEIESTFNSTQFIRVIFDGEDLNFYKSNYHNTHSSILVDVVNKWNDTEYDYEIKLFEYFDLSNIYTLADKYYVQSYLCMKLIKK